MGGLLAFGAEENPVLRNNLQTSSMLESPADAFWALQAEEQQLSKEQQSNHQFDLEQSPKVVNNNIHC